MPKSARHLFDTSKDFHIWLPPLYTRICSKPVFFYHKTKLGFFINFALVFEYFYYQSERRSKHQPSGDNCHPWCFHVFFLWKRQGDIFIFPTKCIGILGKITKCVFPKKNMVFFVFSANLKSCCP